MLQRCNKIKQPEIYIIYSFIEDYKQKYEDSIIKCEDFGVAKCCMFKHQNLIKN